MDATEPRPVGRRAGAAAARQAMRPARDAGVNLRHKTKLERLRNTHSDFERLLSAWECRVSRGRTGTHQ